MKKIVIVGAGGFGRELLWWIEDINKIKPTWEILGFIDDNPHALDGLGCDYRIISSIKDYEPKSDEEVAVAIGNILIKHEIISLLKEKGCVFASVVHPTAKIHKTAKYGEGIIMFPYSKLSCNSEVGNFVTILSTLIGHDTKVGDYSIISGGCNIVRNVCIGKDVFIGAGVCIAQNINIGDGSVLGLGSVVIKDVGPDSEVFGNPARVVPHLK